MYVCMYVFVRESTRGGAEGEGRADSTLGMEPNSRLDPRILRS